MTDITELAQSLKAAADREMICRDGAETSEIWERTVTPENILALVEALEKAQQRIDSQREYYEGVIADGGKRIADLESRTVKLPEPEQWDITQVLLCKKKVVAAIRAAGIKVEAK
ncbi:hypothetical protein [Klebsiella quasipneumoniae]|uniref:hypothetical protein n=1 Tax=Klebsiella quasipneumoniae TaxID=1463165 RepID=UPI001082BB10|nr:hypothetical protein [Klebsiella quasipneumoniae]VGA15471.1 Uncharacterised protein [Klebsiella quasipneumoniae]